jgi:hypothetical protein
MLNALYPFLDLLDAALSDILRPALRIAAFGSVSAALMTALYVLISPQARIRATKGRIKELRKHVLVDTLTFPEVMASARANLRQSFTLLGLVLMPALLSALPTVVFAVWLDARFSFEPPTRGEAVRVQILPEAADVSVEPQGRVYTTSDGTRMAVLDPASPLAFLSGGEPIFTGPPEGWSGGAIHKRQWWNALLADEGGYLSPASPVEEIRFSLRRVVLISGVPEWLGGWEGVFFLALTVVVVALRLAFRIE